MSDLIYRPSLYKGEELYDGTYYVNEKVWDIIKDDGVEFIYKTMAEMLGIRKKMNGIVHESDYGFHERQQFIDLDSRKIIQLKPINQNHIPEGNIKTFQFSKETNNEDFYLLKLWGDFYGPKKNRGSKIKYIQNSPFHKNVKEMIADAFEQVEFLKNMGRL